jgi:PAS domain S-box-containing protein
MKVAEKTKEKGAKEREALRIAKLEKARAGRKRVEDGWGQSTEQSQSLLEEAPIGVCNIDLKGKITYVNKRFEEASGYSRQEVVGQNGFKLGMFSAETMKLLAKRMSGRLMGSPPRLLEVQLKCKDGHLIWIAMEGRIVREKGIPVGFQITAGDITKRKQAEEALKAEKSKLQSIMDAMAHSLTIQDRDFNVIYQNKPSRIASGGDHVGEKCYRAYAHKEKVCDGCPVAMAFRDGKSHTVEKKGVSPSGEIIFWENAASPIRDAKGNIVSCIEVARDITERKQAEEALRESGERFRSIVENSQAGIMILDDAYHFTYVNDELCKMSAYSRKELIGQDFRQFLDEESKKLVADRYIRRQKGEEVPPRYEFNIVRKDGQKRRVEISSTVLKDPAGAVKTLAQLLDITERKQAEEALQQSNRRFRDIAKNAMEWIWEVDAEGKYTYSGPMVKKILGYKPGEVLGKYFYDLFHPDDREELKKAAFKIVAKRQPFRHFLNRNLHKNGRIVWLSTSGVPILDGEGNLIGYRGADVDVTERKLGEEALQGEKNKLQSVVGAMEDGLTIQDKNYNIIYQNEPSKVVSNGERLGEKCYRIYAFRESVCPGCPVREAFKDGKSHTVERKRVTPDGEVTFFENTANPIRDARGKIVSCLEVTRNITSRKLGEEALQAEKNKLQSVINAMEDGLTIQDKDYNIIYQNETLKKIFGNRLGEKCYRVYAHKEKVCDGCLVRKAFRDGKSHTSEKKVTMPSGETAIWEPTANPIRDAKGKIVSCLEIVRDITERKRAEQALIDEATRRRILIDQSLDGIVILDVDAKVYYANQRFAEMLGYTPEEVIELHTWDWDKNYPPEELLEMGRNVDETGLRLETQHHRKDGSVIDVDIGINGAMFGGQKLIFCVCRDITDRKRAEEALQLEKNKLQSVIDALEYGLTIQDKNYNIIYQNEPARISSGGDCVGEKCYRVYEHRDKVCPGCPVKKAFKDGKSHTADRSRISPAGELTFWENTANPIRDAKGNIISCIELGRDITERKKVEQALADEATRRRILIEQSRDGIVVLDQNGKVFEANKRFAEMLGYTPEEAAELHVWDWEYQLPRQQVLEMVRTVDEAGDHFETKHRRKDGSVYDVEISTNGAMFAGQKLIFCVCRDITDRKRAEEKLKESEEKYKTLAEDAPMGIYFNDFTGKFLYGNKRAAEMVGYKRRELVGKSFLKLKLLDSKGMAKAIKLLALNKMGRSTGPDEFVLHRKDGSKSIVEIRTRITKVGGRKVVLGMAEDITERMQMEEALRESEEKLRQMFESVTDGILVVDLKGIITGTNGAAARMHGLKSSEELVGRNALDLVVPSDHERVTANMRQALKQGTVRDAEYTLVRADGSQFPGELSTSALKDADGRSIGHITIARDITERKRAEQARKEAEDKYRNLVEGISDMIWETDEKGVFTFVSPKIKDTLGYDAEEVVGKRRTLDFAPKGEAQKWLPRYKKINAKRVPFYGVEITHIHKNGNPVVFEASGAPFFDSAGNFKGYVGINKDVTERKQAEEEVKRQKAYFQQLFDNSPEGIALLDEADRFVQVNRSFERLFGYRTEELKGRFVNDVLIPEDRNGEAANLSRSALNNQIQRLETVRKRKDGSLVEVDVIGYPIIFDNQTVGVYVIYNDITERKQAERALRESQEFTSSLLESSPNPKFVVNPDTSVKYVNPAFEKLTGFTSQEIVGMKAPYPWWPEEGKREMTASFRNAMVTGGRRAERAMRKKNGERFWVAINSASVVHEGKLLYFLVSWLDITERKQMEEERMELEQKAHLASRLASVGEMAAGIAHEINNPMTSVIGFSQLLMDSELPADVKEDISVIHKEAQRAANVARNLLTFARKHAPTKQPTSMNGIIEGVLKLRAYEQGVSNIRVNTRFAPDLPEVMADYSQMQQVFINIVLNAEGAMLDSGKGGTLTVTTQKVDGFVRASFNDSGPGISRENLNRIFDPFFTTKEVGKGTGLGLSVCHGIVAEHGGRIYARSKPGSGATFVVELPFINSAKSSGERS